MRFCKERIWKEWILPYNTQDKKTVFFGSCLQHSHNWRCE